MISTESSFGALNKTTSGSRIISQEISEEDLSNDEKHDPPPFRIQVTIRKTPSPSPRRPRSITQRFRKKRTTFPNVLVS